MIQLIAVIVSFGFPQYFLKIFSQADNQKISVTKIPEFKLTVGLTLVFSVILFTFFAFSLFDALGGTSKPGFGVAILVGGGLASIDIYTSAMRGRGYLASALFLRDIFWRMFLIVVLGLLLLSFYTFDITNIYILLLVFIAILNVYLINKYSGFLSWKSSDSRLLKKKELLKEANTVKHFWVYALFSLGLPNLHILIASFLLDSLETGAFVAVQKLSFIAFLPMIGMNLVISPMIAKSFSTNATLEIQKISKYSCLICLIVSLTVFVFFVFFGQNILGLFGQNYEFAENSLLLLLFGFVIASALGPTNEFMLMANMESELVKLMIIYNIIGLVLFLILGASYGIFGMCLSIVVLQNIIKISMKKRISEQHKIKIGLI